MKTCAIYARVSDVSQVKGDSIRHQISYCKEYARRRSIDDGTDWGTPDSLIYVDEGITGTSMMKRPAAKQMLHDARARAFDVVLFKGISRFARDTVDALTMLRTLTGYGVRIISMEENFDSSRDRAEFIFTIHSALAQAESEKTAIRVRVGAAEKAKSGQWNGQAPDGYTLNPLTKHLEIDETYAPVISDIFSMYQSGMGVRKIAAELNRLERYTKRGKLWTQRNISRLLRNPVYAGDVVYGRTEKRLVFPDASDPFAHKKRPIRVDNHGLVTICRDAHPGVVTREMFDRVQRTLDSRRPTSGPTEHRYLLTKGLLVCICGSSMTITYNRAGTPYYRCSRQRDCGGATCDSGHIRALDVEREVLAKLRVDILAALKFDELVVPHQAIDRLQERLTAVQASLDKQLDRSQTLFDQYCDGRLVDEQYARMNRTIQNRIQTLQQTQDSLKAELRNYANSPDAEQLARYALQDILRVDAENARLARQILGLFVDKVQVMKSPKGQKHVRIQYRFARPNDAVVQ